MKQIKRIMAFALALVLTLAMSITVFAVDGDETTIDSAKITVSNVGTDATVNYVQIIKADQKTATGWAFTSDAIAKYFTDAFGVTNSNDTTAATAEQQQKAIWMLILYENSAAGENENLSIPTGTTAATAGQLANALDKVKQNVTHTDSFTVQNNIATATVTEAGVYAIMATEPEYTYKEMAAYVGFTTNTSDVNSKLNDAEALVAKKSKDGIDSKESNDSDKVVAIGDTITYTVTAEIPNFDPSEDDTTFKIVDTITGAEYYLNGPDSVNSVEINGYAGDDPAVPSIEADGSSFTVDLSAFINDENSFAGKMVTIQYTVKVTDVTVDNTASITRGLKTETGSKSESLYTGQITLTKYDDASNGLANAEFVLTKGNDETALTFDAATIKDGVRVYTYNPNGDVTELITDENGKLIVEGLDVGKYHFTETKAPTGYSINESGADAELKLDDDADTASAKLTDTTSLSDSKLSALPSTGGIGTTIFTIAGCLIMITAAGLYFASRRKSAK